MAASTVAREGCLLLACSLAWGPTVSSAASCKKVEWVSLHYTGFVPNSAPGTLVPGDGEVSDVACIERGSGSKAFDRSNGASLLAKPEEHTKHCMLYAPCKAA